MTLQNVEKIEAQEKHQKSWFQKFRNVAPAAAVAGGLIASNAHADTTDFLSGATTSLGGIATGLGALFLVAIGITLTIVAFTASKGGVKRAG